MAGGVEAAFLPVGAALLLGVLLAVWWLCLCRPPPGSPPFYAGWLPWLGCALEFGKKPLYFIDEAKQKYGPVFSLFIAGRRMTFLTEGEDFKHFFGSGAADFQMAVQQPVHNIASISKQSFYQTHTKAHDTMKGCLAPSMLAPLRESLNKHFVENLLAWGPEGTGELHSFVRTSMYKAIMDNLFGYNVLGNHTEAYLTLEKHFVKFDDQFEYGSQLPGFFLRDWSKSKHWLLNFFRDVVAKLEKEDQDPDKRITFWTLGLILSHSDILSELREEVTSVLGAPPTGSDVPSLSENDLERLPKVKAAILEAIRLRSPGAIARGAKKSFTVRGYTIPAGDLVLMSPYWAHRNSSVFPDPEQFKPSRWIDQDNVDVTKNIFMEGFVPFGGGRYQCPGRWFALLEMHIYVTLTLHLYDIQLVDPLPPHSPLHLVGTQQPDGPCRVKFCRRK